LNFEDEAFTLPPRRPASAALLLLWLPFLLGKKDLRLKVLPLLFAKMFVPTPREKKDPDDEDGPPPKRDILETIVRVFRIVLKRLICVCFHSRV